MRYLRIFYKYQDRMSCSEGMLKNSLVTEWEKGITAIHFAYFLNLI